MLLKKSPLYFCFLLFLPGCYQAETLSLTGYAHGEFIYLSFPFTETVEQLFVKKGDVVNKGQTLMKVDDFSALNALQIAEKRVQAEKSLLHKLETGERQAALDVIQAQLDRAQSAASLAKSQLARKNQLYKQKLLSVADWEKTKAEYAQKKNQVTELSHQLALKNLPASDNEINHQKSQLETAILQHDKARWDFQHTTLLAPQDAVVYDILYRRGERPVAGKPVITLLPKNNIKFRFYIPEKRLGKIHNGTPVKISCDGCNKPIKGYVNYISARAEFSPPVIYSTQRREKLLFMAEAIPVKEGLFFIKPGQPITLEVMPDE